MGLETWTYFGIAASVRDDETHRTSLAAIDALKKHSFVPTEHLAIRDVKAWERENHNPDLSIQQRDMQWIVDSDLMHMDISNATTGGGGELEFFLNVLRNPALVTWRKGSRASSMYVEKKHPLMILRDYSSIEELVGHIDEFMISRKPNHKLESRYAVVDSIDGAGKGVFSDMWREWANENNLRVFDLTHYNTFAEAIPTWDEAVKMVGRPDVILVAEPTYTQVGKVIRGNLINDREIGIHDAHSTVDAYALDRGLLFKRILESALEEGVWVLSDRGIISSEHYQPIQAEIQNGYDRREMLGYVRGRTGNKIELSHVPGLLVHPQVPVEITQARLELRKEKMDGAMFERRDFQDVLALSYLPDQDKIRPVYARRGTVVHDLFVNSTQEEPETTKQRAREIWDGYLAR